jgi:hypothetical protein
MRIKATQRNLQRLKILKKNTKVIRKFVSPRGTQKKFI